MLNFDDYKTYCDYRRNAYLCYIGTIDQSEFRLYQERFEGLDDDVKKACRQLYDATRKRVQRLRAKIERWLDRGYVYFLTLTFTDSVLERTTESTRRQMVHRYLSKWDLVYCANLDFGSQNGREHYHAIICSQMPLGTEYEYHGKHRVLKTDLLQEWSQKHGYSSCKGPISLDASTPLAKYVSKLSNHAFKPTAVKRRPIYNKTEPDWYKYRPKVKADLDDREWLTLTDDDLASLPFS